MKEEVKWRERQERSEEGIQEEEQEEEVVEE